MATVREGTHRMPMETTAEYSRFRSMGKKGIEEKERTGKKERKGRKGKEGKERKGKERNIIGEKDKKREEDTRKGNRFPPQGTNTWL